MSDDFQSTPPAPPTPPPAAPVGPPPAGGDAPSDNGKLFAALGYPIPLMALLGLLMEPYKNEYAVRFHAVQALGLTVALIAINVVLGVLSVIPYVNIVAGLLWFVAYPAWLVLAIMGAVKAWNGELWQMPLVYGFVKSYIK